MAPLVNIYILNNYIKFVVILTIKKKILALGRGRVFHSDPATPPNY